MVESDTEAHRLPLYRVHYYRREESRSSSRWPFFRTRRLVFALNEQQAREWVKENVEGFDDFTDDHVCTPPNSVERVEYDSAVSVPYSPSEQIKDAVGPLMGPEMDPRKVE